MAGPSPVLSVVMLAFGVEPHLVDAVRAVLSSEDDHGQSLDLEVLLVDNRGSEQSVASVAGLPRVRVLTPDENTGFAGGCNLGAARARGLLPGPGQLRRARLCDCPDQTPERRSRV